ncbi:GNAT family N-acetyltransferase [Lactococcus lactis]|nr:GNAT family N-acetyltransferase [Lactococcus lactis]
MIDLIKDFPTKGEFMLGLLEFVPAVRHQGLGKAVHKILIEKVRDLGAKSLRIGVLEVNNSAIKFWKSLGYIKFKEIEQDFGNKKQKIAVMRLKL